MLAFSNDYYGIIFRATQSVELFCAYFNLSYGNIKVHKMVNDIYHEPSFTYDEIIRKIQTGFLELFSSENFMELLAQEIGNAMTELVNKMFIII